MVGFHQHQERLEAYLHLRAIGNRQTVTLPEDPDIDRPTIDHVSLLISERNRPEFHPHVTVGIATRDYLMVLLAEPFDVSVK